MKKISLLLLIGFLLVAVSASANTPVRSQSLNGATGLISTPTAHTGWDNSAFGLDLGVSYLNSDDHHTDTMIFKGTIQLIKGLEVGAAWDNQEGKKDRDILAHAKFRFHQDKSTALAIGGNYQHLKSPWRGPDNESWHAEQIYLAATYNAQFFGLPSETTIVVGKSFGSHKYGKNNIDFSMGFELDLLPSILGGRIRWITDFANYSYSADPVSVNAAWRGVFNTGARVAILKDSNLKLNLDFIFTDLLDRNRDWGATVCFGVAF